MGVRLRIAGGAVRPRFVPGAEEGDETVEAAGVRVFVAKAILDANGGEVEIDVTAEHEQLTVRPLPSDA
jgi:hypothetical protein